MTMESVRRAGFGVQDPLRIAKHVVRRGQNLVTAYVLERRYPKFTASRPRHLCNVRRNVGYQLLPYPAHVPPWASELDKSEHVVVE